MTVLPVGAFFLPKRSKLGTKRNLKNELDWKPCKHKACGKAETTKKVNLICKLVFRLISFNYYHPIYSILDFDWLIHQQITACKYRSGANSWCKYFTEHAHFENASSASIKNIFLSKCQHGSFCRGIRKRIVHYTGRKGCRKHQKSN